MVYKWSTSLQALLFPVHCRLCGARAETGTSLCAGCLDDLPWLESACPVCASPVAGRQCAGPCGRCQQRAPAFDGTTALFHYAPPVDYLIQRLKFSGELAIAPLLSGLLEQHIRHRATPLPGLVLPVPLHRSRLRERGYNQATELARRLGRSLGIPVDYRLCKRCRKTATQSLLPAGERRRNLRNAFSVTRMLQERHVAVVDDVMTSGHTVNELARTLKRAGAERVEVWVIARAGNQVAG